MEKALRKNILAHETLPHKPRQSTSIQVQVSDPFRQNSKKFLVKIKLKKDMITNHPCKTSVISTIYHQWNCNCLISHQKLSLHYWVSWHLTRYNFLMMSIILNNHQMFMFKGLSSWMQLVNPWFRQLAHNILTNKCIHSLHKKVNLTSL